MASNSLSTPKMPKRITGLGELSQNLWWSWHQEARQLFKGLDRPLWKATCHNPVKLLHQIAPYRLVAAAEDPGFLKEYDAIMSLFQADLSEGQSWYRDTYPLLQRHTIACFSMEFALHNSLPFYAGGLGVLAGDYCKEASDLGLPLVGVGFMYPQGYFCQHISDDGWQEEVYQQLDFSEAPISLVLDARGQPVKATVDLDSRTVHIGVWQVNIGRVKLYLLHTNLEENSPADRQLTDKLYGGDGEKRLQQEIILGIGGVRVLRALQVDPSVWHINEGHAAFSTLERCREWVEKGLSLAEALDRAQATTVFTTHTPVPAGNDTFPANLVEKYFRRYWDSLGLDRGAFMALGTPDSTGDSFNMTVLGLRMARQRNGVSQLHGAVCRRLWSGLWPDANEKDVPIGSVTNGVHIPTWVAPQMARLYEKYLGADWLARHDDPAIWERVDAVPDEELWQARRWLKGKLINMMQDQARRSWSHDGKSSIRAIARGALLDVEALTVGFCRRFTNYKRASLILLDAVRLKRILRNGLQPVQIVFAGKAHPNDHDGKCFIQQVFKIAQDHEFGGRIAFVEDYDMHLARYLVQGVDLWLNTPRPLQEACGTSGMKAALNGVPQLSELDGWWYEAYNGVNGWAIHHDIEACSSGDPDRADAEELYDLLENRIVPLYYDRDSKGIPRRWLLTVKQAIRSSAHQFSARRMAKEYTEQMYSKAALAGEVLQKERAHHQPAFDRRYGPQHTQEVSPESRRLLAR